MEQIGKKAQHSLTGPRSCGRGFVVVSWLCVAVWAAFIFYMSAHTGSDLSTGFTAQVKQILKSMLCAIVGECDDPVSPFCHFCEYAVLGALLINALYCHMSLGRACVLAIACASAYGATDEIHQLFVPSRMCDPLDWITDTAGAALGSGLAWLVLRAVSNKRRSAA